jgi:8-oxo-dGTP pyrophosphatase MutT (NUDIX family)
MNKAQSPSSESPRGSSPQVATASFLADAIAGWPVARCEQLAEGTVISVRRDVVRMPGGDEVGREVIEHPGAVGVVALDEAGQVLLIRQYRHPVGRLLWEIPAGLRDVAGEPPLATAKRELLEEGGYLAADWRVLADFFTSPGISSERLRVYLARGLTYVPDAERDYVPDHEEAHLTIEWAPLDVVVSRMLAGDLHNGVMMIGVLAAFAARQDGFTTLRGADAPEG